MNAVDVTRQLRGRWHGSYGAAPCPVCQPESRRDQNALTLSDSHDGRLLLNCKKIGCGFRDILAAAGIAPGDHRAPYSVEIARREAERRTKVAKRARQAERIWQETQPIGGTPAERYLREVRGITCPLLPTLRFHPACWHGESAKRHPALVAKVKGGEGFALHRTYLRPDGSGKAALHPEKLMLGAVAGGAVRLTDVQGELVVAEGIETALSLASGLLCTPSMVWAALSTSGMTGLRLPLAPGRLNIAADGDSAGRAAAHALAERAHALGWQVFLLPAPEGRDWNDVLLMEGNAT